MRVLAVTSEWPSAGSPHHGRFVQRQIEAVRALGVRVDVEAFRSGKDPRAYAAIRRRVKTRLGDGAYDLVHAHFGQAALAVAGARLPTVITFYGSDLEGIVGASGRYTLRGRVLSRAGRLLARRAAEVVVVSASLGRRLPRGVAFTVIPTGVDAAVFRPGPRDEARRELGLPADASLVLFAGRPEMPVKRHPLAERVAALAGGTLLAVTGLAPEEVAAHMRACDALLVTSRHEGSPTMVREALACGLPVVSVDVGDVRETVRHFPGSVVVEDDDPDTIARALAGVLRAGRPEPEPLPPALDQAHQARRIVEVYRRALDAAG